MTAIHTLVFGDPDAAAGWGAFWLPALDGSAPLACRLGDASGVVTAELEAGGASDPWRLEGEGVSLIFTPSVVPGDNGLVGSGLGGQDQLCTVRGGLSVGGAQHEISCLGWRARMGNGLDLAEIDAFRQTYGWFDPGDGLALAAFRPRKSRGQEMDQVSAALIEPGPTPAIAEPRLSSTYDAEGVPIRVGLELWFETPDSDDEAEASRPNEILRRAAGETVGAALRWEVAGFSIRAVPVRWHSRGSDGWGVYLLGQRG